jgi:hypothetical protein
MTSFAQAFTYEAPPSSIAKIQALHIPFSDKKIKLDGDLNDDIWSEALSVPLNMVNHPWHNKPSPVNTEAKIVENGEFLYISFIADDPNPEDIVGFLGDRDTKWADDLVGLKLDTYNNRRLNYEFFVNPFGVQNDSISNVMTGDSNSAWDGIWQSYGKITNKGYQVEIAIPYHILNFTENDQVKTWAIELIRLYPRDTRLRISHVPFDRDNSCWLCQIPEIKGFKNAKIGNNIMLTPTVVANQHQSRDIYNNQDDWHDNNNTDAGIDLRWGINANTLLNATLNPDFSTVESDAGQLNINKTFSLFYEEKRVFFLENSDYFSSDFDLVYTRNIADPDHGAKLTGTKDAHTYGMFVTNDTETNFIVPGNTGSELASLGLESTSAAFKYRYDFNEDLSMGVISTLRSADNYHNYVAGFDTKYRIDESNVISAQALSSNTEYPDQLSQDFCWGSGNENGCDNKIDTDCVFGNCAFTEQVHRTNQTSDFSDQAVKVNYTHQSEYWEVSVEHQQIGQNFRADLGYMPHADFQQNKINVSKLFYGALDSQWQEASVSGAWHEQRNDNNELLESSISTSAAIDGPMLSNFDVTLTYADKTGLRHNESIIAIKDNTSRFDELQVELYASAQPMPRLFAEVLFTVGDKIDYRNNRLGDYQEFYTNMTVNLTDHLEVDLYYTHSTLEAKNTLPTNEASDNVYRANLTEMRISYQFDVQSYLKLNIVYSDVNRNADNNPVLASQNISKKNRNLSTQLIYAYKLNPQTVFFLGYSDNSYQNDDLANLEREERTFFTKISYAWMP